MSLRRGSASIGSVWALPGGAAGRFVAATGPEILVTAIAFRTPPDRVRRDCPVWPSYRPNP